MKLIVKIVLLGWIAKLDRSPSPWDSPLESFRSPLLSTVFVTREFAGPMSLPAPSIESGTPIFLRCVSSEMYCRTGSGVWRCSVELGVVSVLG